MAAELVLASPETNNSPRCNTLVFIKIKKGYAGEMPESQLVFLRTA
jgi:hypothetical protein